METVTMDLLLIVSGSSAVLSGGTLVALVKGLIALGEFRGEMRQRIVGLEREVFGVETGRRESDKINV